MAKAKNPSGTKGVMDVTHPDKSIPSGNSKSVIISNRPLLQDPMVVAEENKTAPSKADAVKADTETSAEPLPEAQAPKTVDPATTAGAEEAVISPKPAADASDTNDSPATDEPAAEKANVSKDKESETSTNKNPPPSDKNTQKPDAAAQEQAKHHAAVDNLIDSKKYYLPIDTIEKKRSRRFVVLGIILSLLLVVAWADIALDAGIIQVGGIKPVTHFFSN